MKAGGRDQHAADWRGGNMRMGPAHPHPPLTPHSGQEQQEATADGEESLMSNEITAEPEAATSRESFFSDDATKGTD